jgi:hypothetical protein
LLVFSGFTASLQPFVSVGSESVGKAFAEVDFSLLANGSFVALALVEVVAGVAFPHLLEVRGYTGFDFGCLEFSVPVNVPGHPVSFRFGEN